MGFVTCEGDARIWEMYGGCGACEDYYGNISPHPLSPVESLDGPHYDVVQPITVKIEDSGGILLSP